MSDYLIQVINKKNGNVVIAKWSPGFKVEKDFEDELVARIRQKGVGWFKSEEKVARAVVEAFKELLYDLKSQV